MILVIDVGNTNTVLGLMEGQELRARVRLSTEERTTDELGILVMQALAHRGVGKADIDGAIISSVVPSVLYVAHEAYVLGSDELAAPQGKMFSTLIQAEASYKASLKVIETVQETERELLDVFT